MATALMVDELKEHRTFMNGKKKRQIEKASSAFLNFIGAFGDGSSNDNSRF